jgi:hypothetical protein
MQVKVYKKIVKKQEKSRPKNIVKILRRTALNLHVLL